MSRRVSSSVSGGRLSVADEALSNAFIATIRDRARSFTRLGFLWTMAGLEMEGAAFRALMGGSIDPTQDTRSATIRRQSEQCAVYARSCDSLGRSLMTLADQVARAHGLHSQAEGITRSLIASLMRAMGSVNPLAPVAAALVPATAGVLKGILTRGSVNIADALEPSSPLHEGAVSSLAATIAGRPLEIPFTGTNTLAQAAGRLAAITARITDRLQGNHLTVTPVTPSQEVALASRSIPDVLENLRRLSQERLGRTDLHSGLSYATIAIQEYVNPSGERVWLVLVPGTDGEQDSPFGWEQNVELMSSDPRQRMRADSARMVVEAMRRAGIGKNDRVVMAGHSQGGIVTAAIASDMSDSFTISHVITAGSPIANHPIPSSTSVTSIEMEDELVAALDGAANPDGDNKVTIRGRVSESSQDVGTPVKDASEDTEITHWLQYHQAAYADAASWGSPQVLEHDRRMSSLLSGSLVSTSYWQGRMGYGAASEKSAP